jgi:hypothetical protein
MSLVVRGKSFGSEDEGVRAPVAGVTIYPIDVDIDVAARLEDVSFDMFFACIAPHSSGCDGI